ncbi:MAG: UDP-N-acetylmuramoyl-L-alanine--D-glutamate ligase [Bacteroidota bacterium]|nr:UDP-N-acetylmuramoyl-L-alanine--D-glutamate ligase [Bacteroidota bacterium]
MEGKIVILGAGESGLGSAVLAKKKGLNVFVSDNDFISNETKASLDSLGVSWEERKHTFSKMKDADWIIKSPGIKNKSKIVSQLRRVNIPVISEIEFASKFTSSKIIGITGSNGKTTTALLTHHILSQGGLRVGIAGNIGKSFARDIAENNYEYYVLEISSFQLDDIIDFSPNIGVITNVVPDHLDRYENNFKKYLGSKLKITKNQTEEDLLLFNSNDPDLTEQILSLNPKAKLHSYGKKNNWSNNTYHHDKNIIIKTKKRKTMINTLEFSLSGQHNLLNAMAAVTIANLFDISKDKIRESLTNFKGAPHRLEPVLKIQNVKYINDSKATNVNAAFFALESINTPTVWIAGGIDKGNDYEPLLPLVREKVRAIICLGENNEKLFETFYPIIDLMVEVKTMSEAVKIAHNIAKRNDHVLLSPACASFDLFKNYQDRGEQFKKAVKSL